MCRFLSRTSYLSLNAFLLRRRSFTSRKLYLCLVTFLCFLHLSDRAYVSRARCIGLFLILFVLTSHDSNVAVYAEDLTRFATRMRFKDLTAICYGTKRKTKPEFQLGRRPRSRSFPAPPNFIKGKALGNRLLGRFTWKARVMIPAQKWSPRLKN